MKALNYHRVQLTILVMFYVRLFVGLLLCFGAGGLVFTGSPNMVLFGALCIAAALCIVPSHRHARDYTPLT